MLHKFSRLILLTVLLLSTVIAHGQNKSLDKQYFNQLKNFYKRTIQSKPGNPNAFFHADYTILTEMKDGTGINKQETKTELYVSEAKMYSKTQDMELLQDENDSFTIMHNKRIIYRTNSFRYKNKDERLKNMLNLQDSIFNACQLTKVTNLNESTVRLQLTVNNPMRYRLNIRQMEIDFDYKKECLLQTKLVYEQSDEILSVQHTYHSFGFVSKAPVVLSGAVSGKVMLNNKLLLPKYKGYKLIDVR